MEPTGQIYSDRLTENVNKLAGDNLEEWSTSSDVRSSFDNLTGINNNGSGQDNFFSSDSANQNMHFDLFGYSTPESSPNSLYYPLPFPPNYQRLPYESPEEDSVEVFQPRYCGDLPLLNAEAPELSDMNIADRSRQNLREEKQSNLYRCFQQGCSGRSFGRKYDLRRHQATHSSDSLHYVCGECIDKRQKGSSNALFLRKDKLLVHLRKFHRLPEKETTLLRCMLHPCGTSNKEMDFSTQLALNTHINNFHSVVSEPASVFISAHSDENSARSAEPRNGDVPKTPEPSDVAPMSKHSIINAYQPGAKREKLENSSRYSAQLHPTDYQQDCMEIKSVRILEMLALLRLNVLPTTILDLKDFEMSFDFRERAIKLKGPSSVTARVKVEVEDGLFEVRRLTPKELRSSSPVRRRFSSNGLNRFKSNFSTAASGPSPTLFSVRSREDSNVITTWMALIEPRLTDILTPLIGGEYSASLVRQPSTKGSVIPTIRIQSPTGQSKSARDQIRDQINGICDLHDRAKIPLQFSKGSLVRLILTGSSGEASWEYEPMEDDQPNEQQAFPYHRRYYPKPGMSSSVGLNGCDNVSATLGGYIQIDTSFYMLTVDHFIGAATDSAPPTPLEVTSPSVLDRNELTELLKQDIRDIEAKINELVLQHAPSGDIRLTPQPTTGEIVLGALSSPAQDIITAYGDDIAAIQRYQSDLNRKAEDYTLGTICQRCHSESRQSSAGYSFSSPNGDQESVKLFHRMDWSVSAVKTFRRGENQFAQDFCVKSETVDPSPESFHPRGAGMPCQKICDVEPGTAVYYFGQTSGLQRGHIGDVPISIRVDQICSMEWTIVSPPGEQHPAQYYQGDSGAWVMRASDNAVVGLLWGWINGLLIFTSISVVFADIVEAFNATGIYLPRPRLPNLPSPLVPICRVKSKNQSQKPRRYAPAIPVRQLLAGHENPRAEKKPISAPQVPAKEQSSIGEPELMPPGSVRALIDPQGEIMDTDSDVTTSDYPRSRSISPVPSLSSSVSSSPTIVPRILPTIERHLQPGHSSEDTLVVIAEGNDADETFGTEDEPSHYSTLPQSWTRPGKSQQDNRLSIGYILEELSLASFRTSDFSHEKLKRSSGTWPAVESWRTGDGMVTN